MIKIENGVIEFDTAQGKSAVRLENVTNVMYDFQSKKQGKETLKYWVVGFIANGERYGCTAQEKFEAINIYQELKELI